MSRIIINNLSWATPDGTRIFNELSACFNSEITALVGNNGLGKSTIARIICGELIPSSGTVQVEGKVKYLPQNLSVFDSKPVSAVLGVEKKYNAYKNIINGSGTEKHFADLNEDWLIADKTASALAKAGISDIEPERSYNSLSGGEKVKAVLASLYMDNYDFIIFDEPTNHLDLEGRDLVYNFVRNFENGIIIISHDRELLQLADKTVELSNLGLMAFGGNYDFYCEKREIENEAALNDLKNASSEYKKNLIEKKDTLLKQEKRIRVAGKNVLNANIAPTALHKRRGAGEKTQKKLLDIHTRRIEESEEKLEAAKAKLRENKKIIVDIENAGSLKNRTLIRAENLNYSYNGVNFLWKRNISFNVQTGERIVLKGKNGSGKSTLLKIIRGTLTPTEGSLYIGSEKIGFLDQHVSVLNDDLSVLDNVKLRCPDPVPEHELRIRLGRFLFYKEQVFKKAGVLSGGERMRAGLALMLAISRTPDLILLDEPANNLDISALLELTSALNEYNGAIIAVSHDIGFLEDIGIEKEIDHDDE